MSYQFFEHRADIGIRGIGKTIEKSFEEIAKALFDLEVDIKKVKAIKKIIIKAEAQNYEELLVEYLNALLAESGIKEMIFSKFKVKITKDKKANKMKLIAEAQGEKLNIKKHRIKVEVKAATYSELKVYQHKKTKNWISQCIVDV